jgi:Chitobiase/beta-hexosaminidase C-terminal domain/Right handed beta helix region
MPAGDYNIVVTSTGGSVTRNTNFILSVTATVSLVVATPTITPNGGNFSDSVSVSMATDTPGASIYYTTDGATPTQSSELYSGAMTLMSSTVLKAKAFKSGYNPSAEAAASFAIAASSTPPTGNVYYVATSGSDLNSCAQARNISTPKRNLLGANGGISCLFAGDTLDIRAGTYREIFDRNLPGSTTYRNGTASARITMQGHTGETVTIGNMGMGWDPAIQYWTFDNLIVDGSIANNSSWNAMFTGQMSNVIFKNSAIKNGARMCVQGFGTNNLFTNVEIFNCGTAGVPHDDYGVYWSGSDTVFEYIHMHNVGGYGFHIYYSGSSSVSNNTVRYSKIHDTGGTEQNSNAAIIISSGSNNNVYGNLIYNNDRGIQVIGPNAKVYNNTVYNNRRTGNSYYGIFIEPHSINPTTNATVKNNIVYGNGINGILDGGTSSVITNNHCDSAGTGCLTTGNPLFVDAAAQNLALTLGSPAIDRGTALTGIPAYDIEGTSRPRGLSWDMGAYEYK